jgi:uncharacterized coiled-coil protein SlyX
MTELERMLKDTLNRMEQDFSAKLTSQGNGLEELRHALTAHSQGLWQLQEQINRNNADLHTLMRRLEDLAGSYKNLEPLLSRLNGLLSGR